jgi:hypothetical protein
MLRAFRQKVAKPGKIGKKWQNQLKVVKSTKSKVFHQKQKPTPALPAGKQPLQGGE